MFRKKEHVLPIKLKKLSSKSDIDLFAKYKVELIKSHQQYAEKIGLIDQKVNDYDEKDAIRHMGKSNDYQFIIVYNNHGVGILEYNIETSEIDGLKIIYLKNIFIDNKYRNLGIGSDVLLELRRQTNLRIELECWYGMPANDLYKKLGMKELKTRYTWE